MVWGVCYFDVTNVLYQVFTNWTLLFSLLPFCCTIYLLVYIGCVCVWHVCVCGVCVSVSERRGITPGEVESSAHFSFVLSKAVLVKIIILGGQACTLVYPHNLSVVVV